MKITLQLNESETAAALRLADAYNALNRSLGGTGQISAALGVRLLVDTCAIEAKTREVEERLARVLEQKAARVS